MPQKRIHKRVYLDYASATPIDRRVFLAMQPFLRSAYGNPSSIHKEGRVAKEALEEARESIALLMRARPDELVFTGSGTESAALALWGVMRFYPKKHLIVSSIEHPAVLENARSLEKNGYKVTYLPVDEKGFVRVKDVSASLTKDTVLISVMYANNEIGTVQPISEIAKVVRRERANRHSQNEKLPLFFHSDACQASEYLSLNIQKLGIDLLTLNAGKIYGPKGAGLLYIRTGTDIEPLWRGGGHEEGRRSGTENVAGIVGFAKALEIAERRKEKEIIRVSKLRDFMISAIKKRYPHGILLGPEGKDRLPNNIHVSFPGISGETLVVYLDTKGVSVSAGSACDSRKEDVSHVILALGKEKGVAEGGVRFTLGRETTKNDIVYALGALRESLALLSKISIADGRNG